MDEQSKRLTAGPTMAFSPAACMTVSACFGLTMLIQRIDSSIETAEKNTSDAPEERWGLPQEGISPCPFFHGPFAAKGPQARWLACGGRQGPH